MPTQPRQPEPDQNQYGVDYRNALVQHQRSDLDFLTGLADRRGEVLVERIPGLGAPARATLASIRRNPTGKMSELTLEVKSDSELVLVMKEMDRDGRHLERMTIAPPDYATMVELRDLVVARIIDGSRERGTVSICLACSYWPRGEVNPATGRVR